MFKLESYITPIILSYADKYIKNLRLEDSQVSLWGGDASFHNLDLRLEVLEEELQSPFSFTSGHIRELLIHVPWTKLTSEPITITINTIECVLKIKDPNDTGRDTPSPSKEKQKKSHHHTHKNEAEAPPNYVQQLINKIVNNIRIYCNNLILKYVEEDIVLSMNVKHLKVQSCNDKWEAAYTDISPTQVTKRKVIEVNDLTVCLDKRNASGKIDFYQEPMLYRCSMTMHLLRTYHSSTANKTSLTRLDVYCNNMEFSVTEQQVPMFYRLLVLMQALHQKQIKNHADRASTSASSLHAQESGGNTASWAGWAWSYVSAVIPSQWDDELAEDQLLNQSGHIIQIGCYVDNASLTFKVSDAGTENKGIYPKKIRYFPLLTLQLQGIYNEIIMVGRRWTNVQFGVSEVLFLPIGACSCSHPETQEGSIPYLSIGKKSTAHKSHSLFDAQAIENTGKGQYRTYNTNWEFHLYTNTEAVLLERSPAIAGDFLYQMDLLEDSSSDILSEIGSNLEFSNLAEKTNIRLCVAPLKFRVCSGLFHRLSSLQVAAAAYDYPPYYVSKTALTLHELLPPSEEDFDALNEFIPTKWINVKVFEPTIELQFMDHPEFEPKRGLLFKKAKKHSTVGSTQKAQKLPKITVECKLIDVIVSNPMYTNRLIHTTCQLPEPPEKLFNACFATLEVSVIGFGSRLILTPTNSTNMIVPFNISIKHKSIISPQYWIDPDVVHEEIDVQCENLTFNYTKAKLIVAVHILDGIIKRNMDGLKTLTCTSLLYDASKDRSMPYLELNVENGKFRKVTTNATVAWDFSVDAIKAFILEENDGQIQQILFLSGPEPKSERKLEKGRRQSVTYADELPLFTVTFQHPIKADTQKHPCLLIFNLQEIKICVDPLVCKWLLYEPITIRQHKPEEHPLFKTLSETFGSTTSDTQRRSSALLESVHSSSERDLLSSMHKLAPIEEEEPVDCQEQFYEFLREWHPVWQSMVLSGRISQCIIYFPMSSISAIGSQGVEQAVKEGLKKDVIRNVMVIALPLVNIHSSQKQNLYKYLKLLPAKLPETVWQIDHSSFPWTMSISDLTCYSLERKKQTSFLRTVGISATVGLSTRNPNDRSDYSSESLIGTLGIYVHIDVTPLIISVSEEQMFLLASLIYGLSDFLKSLFPPKSIDSQKPDHVTSVVTVASPSISPTARENTNDNTSETLASDLPSHTSSDSVKLTAWIQWTITKFSIELLSKDLSSEMHVKLVLDIEDIVSSLDYQSVYLKLKSKIGSISMQHYKRKGDKDKWVPGAFSGVVIRLREDIAAEKKPEEGGFIGLTLTRASSQHTHNLWGTGAKTAKKMISTTRYITEIVITVQPIDFVVSFKTLLNFYAIVEPFLRGVDESEATIGAESKDTHSWFTNQSLPLAYLECNEIRVIVPTTEQMHHNVFVTQIGKVRLSPSVVNPICRKPLRGDIYRQAVQARVMTMPGSELEDRQYQLDIQGLTIFTTNWKDLERMLNNTVEINENPALEWNKLEQGKLSIGPNLNLTPVVEKFDISVVAAPTMVYKHDIVICSSSFEINFVTDIAIYLSLDQIKLASAIVNEINLPNRTKKETLHEFSLPYSRFDIFSDDLQSELNEFYKDSGIDTSEISRSVMSNKSLVSVKKIVVASKSKEKPHEGPYEMLFTAGKITFCLYQVTQSIQEMSGWGKIKKIGRRSDVEEEDRNYEASEEESIDVSLKRYKKHQPLIFLYLSQPNVYFSVQPFSSVTHVSCFDFGIKIPDPKHKTLTANLPSGPDFPIDLIQTKCGHPDPVTGIPPSFFTMKHTKEHGKNTSFYTQFGRPTKITLSTPKVTTLTNVIAKVKENLPATPTHSQTVDHYVEESRFRSVKTQLQGIDSIQVNSDQIVGVFESDNLVATLTMGRMQTRLFLCERPEKIQLFANLGCVTLATTCRQISRLLLNPWSVSVEISACLDAWQNADADPQIHLAFDSEALMIDLSPEQILYLQTILKELQELSNTPSSSSAPVKTPRFILEDRDQHYKDDLRAGAFQFIEGVNSNEEELPLPYQVMFWHNRDVSAMAWRYPQPRALTKVRIFPVPLESTDLTVTCTLQYFSECHCSYVNYANFALSEHEISYLDLPNEQPQKAVSTVWRVLLDTNDKKGVKLDGSPMSPKALAACLRIDSYFNKSIVADFTAVVSVSKIEVSLHTNFNKNARDLPKSLKYFAFDMQVPETHCFLKIGVTSLRSHLLVWEWEQMHLDLTCIPRATCLDYVFLGEQVLIEPFTFKTEVNIAKQLVLKVTTNDLTLLFGPNIAHTLTMNAQIWSQAFKITRDDDFVPFTRYVICNDTNVNIRLGQMGSEEDILLPSRKFHLYSWRSVKHKRKLRIALEEKSWLWSTPFDIDDECSRVVPISPEDNLGINVSVTRLSNTQKQVTVSGQFVIANMLLEHFEFKLFPESKDDRELRRAQVHVLAGKTIIPSMFIDSEQNYFCRLRFYGLESAWTGDIPLKEHTKGAQPWLVKVPLQERGQFLSIWCRIVIQDDLSGRKVLAMLWPLFMVKSNLPVVSKIHIETPTLNVHLDSSVKGRGEMQQLYCPGTIDHSHQLTFKLHDGTSISDPYIPLNYSLVDQQKFFKKPDDQNIDLILANLRDFDTSNFPSFGDELDNIDWIVEEQPQTTIQVKYDKACLYSSALMVELVPWCLMVNVFGCPVSLMVNGVELCRIPQYGIVAPPNLEDTFHLGIESANGLCLSGPLQLAGSDWSQTFYMPKITGTLAMEGNIKTQIKCGNAIASICLTSLPSDEIRLLKISSTHIFTNSLTNQIQVVCLAVPESDRLYEISPSMLESLSFTASPQMNQTKSGISIIRWFLLDEKQPQEQQVDNYTLYMAFSFKNKLGWSCPLKIDDLVTRRSFSVSVTDEQCISLVLVSEERKGQTYLSLCHDSCPQTLIKNKGPLTLYCAQANDANGNAVSESKNFQYFTKLPKNASVYFTMPFISEKFPELPQTSFSERIVFARAPSRGKSDDLEWSTPVSITNDTEHFVNIPNYGDIKLIVQVTSYATLLCIESVSGVEINAIDIRGRLTRHHDESKSAALEIFKRETSIDRFDTQTSQETSSKMCQYNSLFVPTIPKLWDSVEICTFIKSFSVILLQDQVDSLQRESVASLVFDDIGLVLRETEHLNSSLCIGDIQLDNDLYSKGSFDFPVVIVSQEVKERRDENVIEQDAANLIERTKSDPCLYLELVMESWKDNFTLRQVTGVKDVKVGIHPLSFYIEDLYINKLMDYFNNLIPEKLTDPQNTDLKTTPNSKSLRVKVPELVLWQCVLIARPLNIKYFSVEPLSLLLSVHSSLKMYIALDQSPLQFNQFERRRLLTTSYRLGHAMTMHYLSGAIFGAGWVVSSLELLGSPSGLARAMGTGLRDFISLPYRGLIEGPWAFLMGVTQGSASLMKHVTAGTVQSVTKLASSVARNLDRLTLDEEHLRRAEEQRRQRPQGMREGFLLGLTGLGISLLGAVGGIAHHPLQSLMSDGASPSSLAAGVGLGLVGIVTKPLSGAAELVALTGQGLLQGAGWNTLPQSRSLHSLNAEETYYVLKYEWKLLGSIPHKNILYATDATLVSNNTDFRAIVLVLTDEALIVIDMDEVVIKRIVALSQLQVLAKTSDPTLLFLRIINRVQREGEDEECVMEMDPACRARVADYVRSTASLMRRLPSQNSMDEGGGQDDKNEYIKCYVNPLDRNYLICLLALAKQGTNQLTFPVL